MLGKLNSFKSFLTNTIINNVKGHTDVIVRSLRLTTPSRCFSMKGKEQVVAWVSYFPIFLEERISDVPPFHW